MVDYVQYVRDLYRQELGREGDEAGVQYWANQLASGLFNTDDARRAISLSQEGLRYDIGNLYQTQLGRPVDDEGLKYWSDELLSGRMDLDNVSRSIQAGSEYGKLGAEKYKDILGTTYKEQTGRDPDAAGAEYWGRELLSGKITADQLPDLFSATKEGQVYDIMADKLKRTPDQEGVKYWTDQYESGKITLEELKNAIAQSPEGKRVAFSGGAFGSPAATTPSIVDSVYNGDAEARKKADEAYQQQVASFRQQALANANSGPFQPVTAPAANYSSIFSFQPITTPATTPGMFEAAQPIVPDAANLNMYGTPATTPATTTATATTPATTAANTVANVANTGTSPATTIAYTPLTNTNVF